MEIIAAPTFKREYKQLVKKYPSLRKDLYELEEKLLQNPTAGVYLGRDCYKTRLAIRSKGRGKSGGARVITHFQLLEDSIWLLSIYDKSAKADLAANELDQLLSQINN